MPVNNAAELPTTKNNISGVVTVINDFYVYRYLKITLNRDFSKLARPGRI